MRELSLDFPIHLQKKNVQIEVSPISVPTVQCVPCHFQTSLSLLIQRYILIQNRESIGPNMPPKFVVCPSRRTFKFPLELHSVKDEICKMTIAVHCLTLN